MSNLSKQSHNKNILILMSGSIACYKICTLISKLVQNDYQVKVVMSESATRFIGTTTIEGLSQNPVHTSTFEPGSAMDHIYLDRWADLILLAPATANSVNKLSEGLGDDLITTLFLAHDFKKPFLIAPAMNTQMYLHPVTQKSIQNLKSMNIQILESASGVLACGEIGYGKLLDPELIYTEIQDYLSKTNQAQAIKQQKHQSTRKKILITSGGTQEPIDDIRFISNKSTGKTASVIADHLVHMGFEITYLCSESAVKPELDCIQIPFITYKDLDEYLEVQLQKNKFDIVIHLAAVSDYSVENNKPGKIDSSKETLQLTLKKNPKLINKIKTLSPKSVLVGFKLTSLTDSQHNIKKITSLFKEAQCDYVVHNEWKNVHTKNHLFNLYKENSPVHMDLSLNNLCNYLTEEFLNQRDQI